MKISVIVPVLNASETIGRSLDSIFQSKSVVKEVIVIDGGSTDGTLEKIRNHSDAISRLISEPDSGQSNAINKGFLRASGDILCWLCADDAFRGGALELVARRFAANPNLDVVSGACSRNFIGGSQLIRRVNDQSWDRVGYNNEFDQPSVFWHRRIYDRIGGLNESLKLAMDWEYWNRIKAVMGAYEVVDDILSDYYFSNTNKSSLNPYGHLAETKEIVRRFGPGYGLTEKLYSHLFERFDMAGCYDGGGVSRALKKEHDAYLGFAYTLFDRDVVDMYNWNWISRMIRGAGEEFK